MDERRTSETEGLCRAVEPKPSQRNEAERHRLRLRLQATTTTTRLLGTTLLVVLPCSAADLLSLCLAQSTTGIRAPCHTKYSTAPSPDYVQQ